MIHSAIKIIRKWYFLLNKYKQGNQHGWRKYRSRGQLRVACCIKASWAAVPRIVMVKFRDPLLSTRMICVISFTTKRWFRVSRLNRVISVCVVRGRDPRSTRRPELYSTRDSVPYLACPPENLRVYNFEKLTGIKFNSATMSCGWLYDYHTW
jgi:hypothetical protein